MPLPTSGAISFADIQTELGGINPIGLDEYYKNSSSNYTAHISTFPVTGSSISMDIFRGQEKFRADINVVYTTAGTYTYTVPQGITYLCVLCVGGGGAGVYNTSLAGGAGGGALIWVNNIRVSAGQQFTVVVGAGGNGASGANTGGIAGNASRFYFGTGSTFNIQANGGAGGGTRTGGTRVLTNTAFTVGTSGGGSGGTGGAGVSGVYSGGGAGAAGYSGNGGNGGTNAGGGVTGAGGGGGGGGSATQNAGGAGGVGIYGQGSNGTSGGYNGQGGLPGGGGSGGQSGATTPIFSGMITGGAYGGGGAGNRNSTYPNLNRSGGNGAVRIIAIGRYSTSGRSFPSNAANF
jgi:hypothetical protein